MSEENDSDVTSPKKPGIVFRGSMVPLCAAAGAPIYPAKLPFPTTAPEGTRWIYAAASPAEAEWLTGDAVGFSGPWGVSYPANLRLSFQNMDEAQFIEMARAGEGRPPMPWPSLKAMSDRDLKAIYAYIKSLGPKGEMAPAALSPGVAPDRPHIPFIPQMPAATKG